METDSELLRKDDKILHEIHSELKALTVRIESAFLRDEDGFIDYSGHKHFHKTQRDSLEEFAKSKANTLRNVYIWVTIGILSIVGNSLLQTYLPLFIKPAH